VGAVVVAQVAHALEVDPAADEKDRYGCAADS
jgi:hypothetical protein